ncbi:MAG: PilN domain-containing protein [Nitrospira sp.]|nr:PilN domain-containing protein [Nitrospira sp.]
MTIGNVLIGRLIEPLKAIPLPGSANNQFQINLSHQYRPMVVPLRLLLITACVLLALGIFWNLRQMSLVYQECRIIEAELDRVRQQDRDLIVEARHEGIDLSEEALKKLPFEVQLANQILEKRTFSWTRFLTELEQAIPSHLALISVRLDQTGTMVRLKGTATSFEDITTFTVGLQDHVIFKDPILAQHRVAPNGLVEFDIALQYRHEGM